MITSLPLKQLAEIAAGQGAPQSKEDYSSDGIPFVRAGSLDMLLSKGDERQLEKISHEAAKKNGLRLFPKGSILFAKSGMSATKDRVYVLKQDSFVVSHLAVIIPREDQLDSFFFKYWMNHFRPSRLIKDSAYPSIRLQDIEVISFPKLDVASQKAVAEILSRAESALEKRREAIRLLGDFLKSTFLAMFGDPVKNPREWNAPSLEGADVEIIDGDRGVNYPKGNEFYSAGYCLFLNTKNVTKTGFRFDDVMFITEEKDNLLRKGKLKRDDIVLTTRGTIGNVALYSDSVPFKHIRINSGMLILRLNPETYDHVFFEHLLLSDAIQKQMQKIASGCAQPQLPVRSLKRLQLITPLIEKQRKFSIIVRNVDKVRLKMKSSEAELQNLFNALMQKAFKGEL